MTQAHLETAPATEPSTTPPLSVRKKIALRYQRRDAEFQKFVKAQDLRIHASETITIPAGPYLDKVFLIGVNFFYCKEGAFKLTFSDHKPLTIRAGEVMTVYSGRFVTFTATDKKGPNTLNYTILCGSFAEEYVSSVGFYDFFHCSCAFPVASLNILQSLLETHDMTEPASKKEPMSLLYSMMLTVLEQAKLKGDAFFYDAIQLINQNVAKGQVRIEPVCEALSISRAQLHRIFVRYGFTSVGAYIKSVQYQFAMKLLRVSRLSVSEIAHRSGFASATNFTAFIRKRSGQAPIKHRGKHITASAESKE